MSLLFFLLLLFILYLWITGLLSNIKSSKIQKTKFNRANFALRDLRFSLQKWNTAFKCEICHHSLICFIRDNHKSPTVRNSWNDKFGDKIFSGLYLVQDLCMLYSVKKYYFLVFFPDIYCNDKSLTRVFRIFQ